MDKQDRPRPMLPKTVTEGLASRRQFLASAGAGALVLAAGLPDAGAETRPMITRPVPSTGERIPVIGMGTWITFNVGDDTELRDHRTQILDAFFQHGGAVIDSSPMYGSSEAVIGYGLEKLAYPKSLFSATKVWTPFGGRGVSQMAESEDLWGVDRFDLMQIHNLVGWQDHLETLLEWKEQGRIRYIGITTSHGRRHDEFEKIMAEQPIDFAQFTYNIVDRRAEDRLLPLAAERGLGVVINRPFKRKQLFHMFEEHPLPDWADECDCANWAEFFLKFIVSHPAVTCAIPATSRVDHMLENMGANFGRLPDAALRKRMADYVASL